MLYRLIYASEAADHLTPDGVQSLQVTDGTTTKVIVLGGAAAETLAALGANAADATHLYAGGGDDVIELGVSQAVTANGGNGTSPTPSSSWIMFGSGGGGNWGNRSPRLRSAPRQELATRSIAMGLILPEDR